MDWQIVLVGLAVAIASSYLASRSWRTWFAGKSGCSSGCGCSNKAGGNAATAHFIAADQLRLRPVLPPQHETPE